MARFIEEPELDSGDKVEGVRGMLEGFVEGVNGVQLAINGPGFGIDGSHRVRLPDEVEKVLEGMIEEWERLRSEDGDEEEEVKGELTWCWLRVSLKPFLAVSMSPGLPEVLFPRPFRLHFLHLFSFITIRRFLPPP